MNDCCRQEENQEVRQERQDLQVTTCRVCGLRQFELQVDPGLIGVTGVTL